MRKKINNFSLFLSLFTSGSTLICCALPALFVALGAGTVFASITSAFPQLILISEHKNSLFVVAGLLLVISGYFQYLNRSIDCDVAEKKEVCRQTKKYSFLLWKISLFIYLIGLAFALVPTLL